jgi:hypothetical protein
MNEEAPDAIRPLKRKRKSRPKKRRRAHFGFPPFIRLVFASEAFVANRCAPILARLCANVAERRRCGCNAELFGATK